MREMQNTLTLKEYTEYSIFYNNEPCPEDKVLYQVVKIGTMLLNLWSKGSPFKFDDILIKYWPEEKQQQSPGDIKKFMLSKNKKSNVKLTKEEVNQKIIELKKQKHPSDKKYYLEGKIKDRKTLPKRLRQGGN